MYIYSGFLLLYSELIGVFLILILRCLHLVCTSVFSSLRGFIIHIFWHIKLLCISVSEQMDIQDVCIFNSTYI